MEGEPILIAQLNELITHIFSFVDACGYYKAVLTCKLWNKLINNFEIWEEMVNSLIRDLNYIGASEWLHLEEVMDVVAEIESKKSGGGDPLIKKKNTYRALATSLIVVPPTENIDEMRKKIDRAFVNHTNIRKQRVFRSINEALEIALPGDYLQLGEGRFEEEVVMSFPVHIFGTRSKGKGDQAGQYYYNSTYTASITWKNLNGLATFQRCHLRGTPELKILNSTVDMRKMVYRSEGNISIGEGGKLKIWGCDISTTVHPLHIHENFGYLDVSNTYLEETFFQLSDVKKIFQKLLKTRDNPDKDTIIACGRTLHSIWELKKEEHVSYLLEEKILEVLTGFLKSVNNEEIYKHIIAPMNRLLLTYHKGLGEALASINLIPLLEDIIRKTSNHNLLEWINIFLFNLVDRVEERQYFTESLYITLLNTLKQNYKSLVVAYETISFFWPSAHRLSSIRETLINGLLIVSEALYEHGDNRKLYNETMGLVWNLPGKWPEHITTAMVPHLLKALKLATNYKRTNTALGAFLIVMPNVISTHVEYLIDHNAINLLLELKEKEYMKDEAENRLWKAFVWLGKHERGQTVLLTLIRRDLKHPPLSNLDKIKIARALTIQSTVNPLLYDRLAKLIQETREGEGFFFILDAVVHLVQNEVTKKDSKKIDLIRSLFLERVKSFITFNPVSRWIGWATSHLNGLLCSPTTVQMDPQRSVGVHIASNGLLCRHSFATVFGTTIGTHCVTKGKWYYEVELETGGLFQLGWATDKFRPSPEGGNGVGDDKNSWSIDLKRHAKWHENEQGSLCQPYGEGKTLSAGDVIGCLLDLDTMNMSFTYNSENLGTAFDDFHIGNGLYPALSMNLENECSFNFGSHSFKFHPPPEFKPFVMVAKSNNK